VSYYSFPAMGTQVAAWGCHDQRRLRCWFAEVETTCSRFDPDSELSRINRSGLSSHHVSDLLAEVLQVGDHARKISDGVVDIGVGAAVSAWGYDRTFSDVADLENRPETPSYGRWGVHGSRLSRGPGTSLDLGGVAKGWSCDVAVERQLATVVSAGGDMRSNDPETMASLLDPWGETVARFRLGIGALATSSVVRRSWEVEGERVSHLIDPRSMAPVDGPVVSASVIAWTAVDAEIGAKTVLILGTGGLNWADEQDWIQSALVVWADGAVYATSASRWAA
jgi:FAD:protein FMN transferase